MFRERNGVTVVKKKFELLRRFRVVHPKCARVTLHCNFVSCNVRSLLNEVFARSTNHGVDNLDFAVENVTLDVHTRYMDIMDSLLHAKSCIPAYGDSIILCLLK